MKKRVLMLVENLPVPFDRRVWMEATTLREAGYQVSVICPKGQYKKLHEELEGIQIYRYPLPSLESVLGHLLEYAVALPVTFLLTLWVALRGGIDIIHSANPPDFFFIIGRFFQMFGKKYIFDHHDLMPEICDSRYSGWKHRVARSLSVWAEGKTFRTADWIISTNESYRRVAITRGGVNPQRVTVVRSGPKQSKFFPVAPNEAIKHGKKYLVSYLGVMGANDGLDYLLRAIDYVVHDLCRDDVQFTLIGSGDLLPKLKIMSQELGLSSCVEFTGRIPDEQVREILSTSDLCVAPDPKDQLNDVSTMNKVIEYMAMSKPIVSFDLQESRISAEEAAVYASSNDTVDFAKKIDEMLNLPQKCLEMGQFGRRRFETVLAWEYQREKLLSVYKALSI